MQGQGQAQRWARGAARADVVGTSHVLGPGKRGFLRLSFILCNPHQELATDIVLSPFTCEESEAPGDGEICSHRPSLAEAGLKPGTLKQCSSLQPTTCDILYSRLGGGGHCTGISFISDTDWVALCKPLNLSGFVSSAFSSDNNAPSVFPVGVW